MNYSYEEFCYDLEEMIENKSKDLKEFEEQYPEYTNKFKAEIRGIYKDFFKGD